MLLLAGGSKAYGGVKGERSKDDLSMTLPIIPKNKRGMTWHGGSSGKQQQAQRRAPALVTGRSQDDLDCMRYSAVVTATRSTCYGEPQSAGLLEARRADIMKAARQGDFEAALGNEEKDIVAEIRGHLTALRVDPALVLRTLTTLLDYVVQEMQHREEILDATKTDLQQQIDEASQENAGLRSERATMGEARQELERALLEKEHEKEELQQTIVALEADLKEKASADGISAEEFTLVKVQLSKARAAAEASRKQLESMQDKMLEAERSKREEEVALREKRGQIERELRDFKQNYGPDKVNELRQQMEESIAELDQLKDQHRKSKMANRQQHHLVVEWKIKITEIEARMEEQDTLVREQQEELEKRAKQISDLKTTGAQLSQDIKKTQSMLSQTNQQLTEYVEKYTRQTAYVKQQEGLWKAMQAKNRLALSTSGDAPPEEIVTRKGKGSSPEPAQPPGGGAQPTQAPPLTADGGISRIQSANSVAFYNDGV